jgi:hypothetical protein
MRWLSKEGFNMKVKGKYPTGRPRLRWEQQVRKHIIQREGKP